MASSYMDWWANAISDLPPRSQALVDFVIGLQDTPLSPIVLRVVDLFWDANLQSSSSLSADQTPQNLDRFGRGGGPSPQHFRKVGYP